MTDRPHPTIDETIDAYLRMLQGANKSAATITAYRTDLDQFARFLAETNCTIATPADIRRGDITEYLAHLAARGISGTSRARKLAAVQEYFRFLLALPLMAPRPSRPAPTAPPAR